MSDTEKGIVKKLKKIEQKAWTKLLELDESGDLEPEVPFYESKIVVKDAIMDITGTQIPTRETFIIKVSYCKVDKNTVLYYTISSKDDKSLLAMNCPVDSFNSIIDYVLHREDDMPF